MRPGLLQPALVHPLPDAESLQAQQMRPPQVEAARPHQPQDAEAAVHSGAQRPGEADEAEQASEAEALTQRISRRWSVEIHDRRDREAIEFRFAEQDARSPRDAPSYVSAGAKISGLSSMPFASRISAA